MNYRSAFTVLLTGLWFSLASEVPAFQSNFMTVKAEGSGPDVILIHGFASSSEVWSELAKEIGSGHRLHFVDVAGFAGSPAPKTAPESYLTTLRDEIVRYIDSEGLKHPSLIGHSMGGLTSLLVASHAPAKISKVIVVDALPFFSLIFNSAATAEQALPFAQGLEKQLVDLDDAQFEDQARRSIAILTKSSEKRDLLLQWTKASDRKLYAKAVAEMMVHDARPSLSTIACPVTVIHAYDPAMNMAEEQLKALYTTAYSKLGNVSIKTVPESLHFVMWDQPKGFQGMVKEALGSDPAAASSGHEKR